MALNSHVRTLGLIWKCLSRAGPLEGPSAGRVDWAWTGSLEAGEPLRIIGRLRSGGAPESGSGNGGEQGPSETCAFVPLCSVGRGRDDNSTGGRQWRPLPPCHGPRYSTPSRCLLWEALARLLQPGQPQPPRNSCLANTCLSQFLGTPGTLLSSGNMVGGEYPQVCCFHWCQMLKPGLLGGREGDRRCLGPVI